MQAYKFETRISKTGNINLPIHNHLFNKEVEVIIVLKEKVQSPKKKISDFVEEWAGFLTNKSVEDSKFQYLIDKYK